MRVKGNPVVLIVVLGLWILMSIANFISLNHGYFEYNSMKSNSQVLEGRIASINMESQRSYSYTRHRNRYNTYLKALVVYTEDGEEKMEEFHFPLFKGEGDSVKLARLPDGSLVPLFIQLSGNMSTMIIFGTFLVLAIVIFVRTKLYPKAAASSSNTVRLVTDDFDQYVSQEERLMTMVNPQSQTINTNEEVDISEEPEAVIPVSLRGKEQDPFYSLEDPGEYEGINLDDLVVEKLDD